MAPGDHTAAGRDADRALQAWERLRAALGASGIGTWHLDLRTRIATYDESLNRIFGLPEAETQAPLERRLEQIHPDDRARVAAAMEDAVANRAEFSLEFRVVRPDGSVRWLRDRGRTITADDGAAVVATGAVIDITEQRRLEEHDRVLADITQAFAGVLDFEQALADICAALVPRFAAAAVVHLRESDSLRQAACVGDSRLVPPAEQVAEAVRSGTIAEAARVILPLRAGGMPFGCVTFALSAGRFEASDVAFANELADRMALLLDRARLFRDLERANRVKDEFLATLSHELRTPLNAVLGWTRMLRRGAVPADRTPAVLETIERNASAQVQLVEELLDLSAMTAGGLRLNMTRVDLRDVVGGAIETVRPAADAKALRVGLHIAEPVADIVGDPARLRQVLWNLLANAVKFTPAGGAVDVTVADGPGAVEIVVSDTGPGIPPDFLPHVFDPFRQADSGATRSVSGLGLGLTIVRHIVDAHGGTVSARSDGPDRGSAFVVRLPTAQTPRPTEASSGSLRGRRVLAVDDDEATQDLVATMLLMYGVSVRTAGRSAQAMEILAEWRPDVLLADIAMPGEDGYALLRRIRALPPPIGGIRAVALTGFTDPQSVQAAFAAGFDAHLGKPLEPHVLADALSKVLGVKRGTP